MRPELIAFHEKHKHKNAMVIAIDFEEIDEGPLRAFIKELGMNYPVLRIGTSPLIPFEPWIGLPSTFFVNPAGEYVAKHVGPLTGEMLEEYIDKGAAQGKRATPE